MTTYYKGFPQSTREEKLHMVNLDELENEAKYVIPEAAYYYIASGAENEWTWRNNTQAFNHFQIVPRALTGMQDPKLNTEFLGMKLKTPVMICPIACHGIANAEAEVDTAKGAKAAGALFGMSTYANKSVQDVQSAVGDSPRFMQLYLSKNWDFNKMVIEESVKAGFTGFFLTVDALVSGYREANLRTNFTYPVPLAFFNEWTGGKGEGQSVAQMYASSAQNIGPDDIRKIKEIADVPVIVKGVECAEDAMLAIGAGADGIVVSNHGGREVDGAPATIDVLPEIAKAVKSCDTLFRLSLMVAFVADHMSLRHQHQVLIQLVLVVHSYTAQHLVVLKAFQSVIDQLNKELLIDMQLTGCKTIEDIKHAKIDHLDYTADWGISSTSKSVMKPYPVTKENQLTGEAADAVSGASRHQFNDVNI